MTANTPHIRIGLPYSSRGPLLEAAQRAGGRVLISAGSLRRKSRKGEKVWSPIGDAAWMANDAALDSAGFVAMLKGGYDWDVSEFVEFVVTSRGDGSRPFPWTWWSAMDFCCEQEIAADRAEVERRIDLTIETYGDTLAELDWWRAEGDTETPDPMPIIQGRTAVDYVRCFRGLVEQLRAHGRAIPARFGVGSVCRRHLHGDEGLIPVLEALAAELPEGVQLHLFGVKGDALGLLVDRFPGLVESIDSMAWDFAARIEARKAGIKNTTAHRAAVLTRWAQTQAAKVAAAVAQLDAANEPAWNGAGVQLDLFAA
jgi:hypothetical protein